MVRPISARDQAEWAPGERSRGANLTIRPLTPSLWKDLEALLRKDNPDGYGIGSARP